MKSSIQRLLLTTVIFLFTVPPAWPAKPYKIYVINRYGAWDIVCDTYTVQKDDHVWDILRRKGSIAEKDFPRFVTILKELNPGIKNVNKIYPSQEILVPLKEVEAQERPAHSSPRYMTIPMIPDILYDTHEVRSGECLSRIVTGYLGVGWDDIPKGYFRTFKRLNPRIKNMDLIYPDQVLRIPELPAQGATPLEGLAATPEEDRRVPEVTQEKAVLARSTPQVPSAFPPAEKRAPEPEALLPERPPEKGRLEGAPPRRSVPSKVEAPAWQEELAKTMNRLGSKMLTSGQCYFPKKDRGEVTLDLSAFPVIEFQDGRHLLLETGQRLPKDMEAVIRAAWKDLMILRSDPADPYDVVLDQAFRAMFGDKVQQVIKLPAFEDGIQVTLRGDWILPGEANTGNPRAHQCVTLIENSGESTSSSVIEYLAEADIQVVDIVSREEKEKATPISEKKAWKDFPVFPIDGSGQEAFVSGFVKALGYTYESRVPLTFDYAGFQVQTTANLVYGGESVDVVIDFGTFFGEAKAAVEAGGLKVLSITPDKDLITIAKDILTVTGRAYTEGPVLLAANRERSRAASLTIPGILISEVNEERALLSKGPLHPRLCQFLGEKQIRPLQVKRVAQ